MRGGLRVENTAKRKGDPYPIGVFVKAVWIFITILLLLVTITIAIISLDTIYKC
jgi:hypothetical protein